MNRIILHIDMDYFFAQIEERENPRFRGKPVVVGADPKGGSARGVVSTCNYEAREYGIHSAMPISGAWQLCPKAIFLPVNMKFYQRVSENIMEIIKRYSKIWEIVSLDEAYLDISFLKNYEKALVLARKIKEEILEKEKLTSTVGIGPNKLIAKMATDKAKSLTRAKSKTRAGLGSGLSRTELCSSSGLGAGPNGLLIIKPNQVRKFLEPLDIEDLPGIGPRTAERLREIGANKIEELKNLSKSKLRDMFGKSGETIYERARGIDETPVTPEEILKSIGKEHTFEKDTRVPEIIFGTFDEIIKNVYQELIENKFSFRTITVICRFHGFETHTKSKTLKEPTNNLEILKKEAKNLILKFLIENPKLIRLIGLRVKIH